MICNLNQVSFRDYGSVLPERGKNVRPAGKTTSLTLNLDPAAATVYRARSDTWISCGSGTSVLCVSTDGERFLEFYLDKAVSLRKGLYYALEPFKGNSSVQICTGTLPEVVGRRKCGSFRVSHTLRVEGIYTFFYQEKEQGFLFSGESHPMPELTYVDGGELHSVADGQDLLLKQGDLVIYGSNQWHMQYADIGVAPRFITISFDVTGTDLSPLLNRRFAAPRQAVSLLQGMLQEQERMAPHADDVILSQLTMLLAVLLRETDAPTADRLRGANAVHSENEIVRQAQQFISEHIREKLSVPLVAAHVDVSPSYLTVLFHKNLQISPGEYIRRVKLQESKQMIRENDLNFTEIAALLQYSTVHHFSRQFKEKFGITPSEYAKSVR